MYRNKKFVTFFIVVCIVLCAAFPAMADVNDLSIYTDSNASVYYPDANVLYSSGVSTFSNIARVTNTVDYDSVTLYVRVVNEETGMLEYFTPKVNSDGTFSYYVPSGYSADVYGFRLRKGALPSPGKYRFRLDFAAHNSDEYNAFELVSFKYPTNANGIALQEDITPFVEQLSGEFYADFILDLNSIDILEFKAYKPYYSPAGSVFAGQVKVNFSLTDSSAEVDTVTGPVEDFDYDMSNSLSDISSGMADQAESIQNVADAIQSLQGAMEPHYSNVLTQLHHITEQLHAFWDQLYNMFFLPQYALLGEIRDAITGMETGLGGVISDASSAIQAKLQSVQDAVTSKIQDATDQITNGFDNSELNSSIEKLEDVVNAANDAETQVIEQMSGLQEFDAFPMPGLEELSPNTLSSLSWFGVILMQFILSMGEFAFIPFISLSLSLVSVIVGLYRFK